MTRTICAISILLLIGFAFVQGAEAQLQGSAGNVRVNIEWEGDVDLDLYVTDPCGNVFGYSEATVADCAEFRGAWDIDDTGPGVGSDNPHAENIVWTEGAPVGTYQVHVNYFGGTSPTNYTLRIFLGDRENPTSTHLGTIGPDESGRRRHVANFEADETVNLPIVGVSAGPAIEEGEAATFTFTAEPPPTISLEVAVTVRQTGDFADSDDIGLRTVTIDSDGTGTLIVPTIDDANDEASGTIAASIADGEGYTVSASSRTVTVEVSDDDTAGVALTPTTLTLLEGESVNYTVALATRPSGDVTIEVSSDNPGVTVSPERLTFTPSTWNAPQRVSVTAAQDADSNADTAKLDHAVHGYGDLADGGTVAVEVSDDDTAGVALTPTTLTLLEGESVNYTVALATRPSGDVTIEVSSDNPDVTVSPERLTFTPSTWNAPQRVSVTAAQDADSNADTAKLDHAVHGYGDLADGGTVAVEVSDDDTAGVTLPTTELTVHEGDTGTYAVHLATAPVDDMATVTPRSSNPHIEFTPTSLTFDSDNWDTPQQMSFSIEEENQSSSVTILHDVSGYGELTEGGVVTVSVVQSLPEPDSERKQAAERTVAAVAAAAVSNVTSNIGARFSAPSTGGASISLAGTPIAFGHGNPRNVRGTSLSSQRGLSDEDSWQWRTRSLTGDELLGSSSFEIALGAAEGSNGNSPDAPRGLTVWGRGDFQVFESGGGQNSGYDGGLVAGYLGADFLTAGGWLTGLAISRISAEADYVLANADGGGKLEAELTNIHPYLRFAVDDSSEAWAILGLGKGEVTDSAEGAAKSKTDMSMKMLSAGARYLLNSFIGVDWALLGDGSLASVETAEGVQSVDGISANVWRARVGVEASHTTAWESGAALTSFLEVAVRQDGGDGADGVGLEVSPGLALSDPQSGLAVEARGRALALHSADNHQEYGASITVSKTSYANGTGLSLAMTPTWGTPTNSLDSLDANLFSREVVGGRADSLSLNSRVAYGFAAGRGVLSPFAEFSLHDGDNHRTRVGSRYSLGPSVDLELSGDRTGGGTGNSEHSVQLRARIGF